MMINRWIGIAFVLCLLNTVTVGLKHHSDHGYVYLLNEHIHTGSAKHFHEEQHPNLNQAHKSLEERLNDPLKNTFLVHFASVDAMHNHADQIVHQDPEVLYEAYVAQGGFIVHMTHQKAKEISELEYIDWVGYFKPAHKVDASIYQLNAVSKSITVDLIHSHSREEIEALVTQWLDSDADFQENVVVESTDFDQRIIFQITNESEDVLVKLAEFLSHQREVHSVARKTIMTAENRWSKSVMQLGSEKNTNYSTPTTDLPYWKAGLTGKGQVVGIGDTGLDYRSCFWADVESTTPPLPPFYTWTSTATNGQMFNANDLNRRKIVQYVSFGNTADDNGHGTHCAGSIAGYPANDAVLTYRNNSGAAKDAKIAFFDIEASATSGLRLPTSLTNQYFPWAYAAGARLHSNSWGSSTPNYDSSARDFDNFMFQKKDFLSLVAAGNSGSCGSQAATVGSPASAKNILSVGASVNSAEMWKVISTSEVNTYKTRANYSMISMASFSSQGPTGDGRMKPDISAPGYFVLSSVNGQTAGSVCSAANAATAVGYKAGTSMATPTLAGSVALVRQYLVEGYYPSGKKTLADGFSPSGSLMKAMTINGAVNMIGQKVSTATQTTATATAPTVTTCSAAQTVLQLTKRPSHVQGFGRFQMNQVMYLSSLSNDSYVFIPSLNRSNTALFSDSTIAGGKTASYDFCAFNNAARREIRISLVWTDPAGSTAAQFALVNDLDLIVTYRGQTIYGNTQSTVLSVSNSFLTNTKGLTTTTNRDSLNNAESVYLTAATATEGKLDLKIQVKGVTVPQGPQAYSLVVSGFLAQGTCASNSQAGAPVPKPATSSLNTASIKNIGTGIGVAAGLVVAAGCVALFVYAKKNPDSKVGSFFSSRKNDKSTPMLGGQKQTNIAL